MSLIKWSPFFFEPFESMDKMLEEMQALAPRTGFASLVPPINMYENKGALVVEVPLPGVDDKSIELSVENGTLSIKGSSERKTEVDEKNYYRREIRSGSLFRQVALPIGVDESKTDAVFENGILKITMPKKSGDRSTKIAVKKKS